MPRSSFGLWVKILIWSLLNAGFATLIFFQASLTLFQPEQTRAVFLST
jgi:hypothetical protein